jgi:endoglucanase
MHTARHSLWIVTTSLLLLGMLASCTPSGPVSLSIEGRPARGINLGNALEAPVEGEWGLVLQAEHFALIRQAGFDLVRIPIRWSAHAQTEPPYTIDAAFFERIDWVLSQARRQRLIVIINMHHYDDIYTDLAHHRKRFLALWQQIAHRYRKQGPSLLFEPLNEPNGAMDGDPWNELAAEVIAVIRQSNPTRGIVLGPGNWNRIAQLLNLKLPPDPNLIVTFHYYEPFHFTHQGAEWVSGSSGWRGTTWEGKWWEQTPIGEELDLAKKIADQNGWQLFMGEFGAYNKADMDSRVRWTRYLAQEAEARGIAWAYWEFGAGFGVYDPATGAWRKELLRALIPDSPAGR